MLIKNLHEIIEKHLAKPLKSIAFVVVTTVYQVSAASILHYFSLQVNQPQQAPSNVLNEAPDDYLLPAILTCIFCLLNPNDCFYTCFSCKSK